MAMIACPGCGLPREDGKVGVVACPVCEGTTDVPRSALQPERNKVPFVDPTSGLPADVNQMEAQTVSGPGRPRVRLVAALAFLVGVAAGVGGLLTWQHASIIVRPEPIVPNRADAAASNSSSSKPLEIAIAPRPRARASRDGSRTEDQHCRRFDSGRPSSSICTNRIRRTPFRS